MMDCTNCNRQVDYPPVPFVVHENLRAQMDLHARRLVRVIVLLIVLLVGSNALWLWHESMYAVERTITEIEQDTDGGGPYRDVARCFDCSGYVSFCLKSVGALDRRTDCDGLFARSEEIYSPIDGCLLFRVNPKNPKDETHVGIYFQGKQYEARGRKDGVVCIDYNPNYWQKLAWFKALKHDEPSPQPEPPVYSEKVLVKGKSVWVRDSDSTKGKKLFVAHKGQTFDLIDIAPSGWYHIMTTYPDAYITNKPRYTEKTNG